MAVLLDTPLSLIQLSHTSKRFVKYYNKHLAKFISSFNSLDQLVGSVDEHDCQMRSLIYLMLSRDGNSESQKVIQHNEIFSITENFPTLTGSGRSS